MDSISLNTRYPFFFLIKLESFTRNSLCWLSWRLDEVLEEAKRDSSGFCKNC